MKALAILLALASPAAASAPCASLADTAAMLFEHGWTAHSGGVTDGATVTVYTNPDGRWIALYVTGDKACIVSSGTGWGAVKPNA